MTRTLTLTVTAAALAIAPLSLAAGADAAPNYSVSVLHCGGGISIKAFATHAGAVKAKNRAVHAQRNHPGSLRTIQLRHGSKVIASSTRPC